MSQALRHPDILDFARRDGRVTVEHLAEHFGVTAQTIRRDLSDLAEDGKLERVHGGAVLPSGVANIGYQDRRDMARQAKATIAAACAEAVPDGCAIFLGIGTSTEAVAMELRRRRDLLVVTNNLNVANIFLDTPDCEIVVAGGALRRSDRGLVGQLTIRTIEQFKFDLAIIGCSALDADGDLLDFDIQEVGVSQMILARARATYLVADATKFERTAPVRIASLRDVTRFFTDRPLPGPLATSCKSWGTEVQITPLATSDLEF